MTEITTCGDRHVRNNCPGIYPAADSEIEELFLMLSLYPLDPVFERYGNFVNENPVWQIPELIEKYKGHAHIWGNFLGYSYAFDINTDDTELIERFKKAVAENKKRPDYIQAKHDEEFREAQRYIKISDVQRLYRILDDMKRDLEKEVR